MAAYGIDASAEALKGFLQRSSLLASQHLLQDTEKIALVGQAICLSDMRVNSYHASVLEVKSDWLPHWLVAALSLGGSDTDELLKSLGM